jgi:hypothetical protein
MDDELVAIDRTRYFFKTLAKESTCRLKKTMKKCMWASAYGWEGRLRELAPKNAKP